MGSYCGLSFDDISIIDHKSSVPDDFICLFQENDRWMGAADPDSDDYSVSYRAPRAVILKRMDLMGYTAGAARRHFESWLAQERQNYDELVESGEDWASGTSQALRLLNYEEWRKRAREVLLTRYDFSRPHDSFLDDIDRQMRDRSEGWLFYTGEVLPILRSLLQLFPEVDYVSLDITALVTGGYIDAGERICEIRRSPSAQIPSDLQPTVIIAEGSTDILVLKKSLQRLYPHLIEYFTFFDHDGPKADGGASYLVKFLRAFAAARINSNIIAVFDNDAAGLDAFNAASKLPLPTNIKVTRLPDIDIGRAYPTIGPQGQHDIDINGTAVGIELFLGRHNLVGTDGLLLPVIWSNFVPGTGRYQGALKEKRTPLVRFLKDTKADGDCESFRSRFPELVLFWEHIFDLMGSSA